jgi:hypothetical protein
LLAAPEQVTVTLNEQVAVVPRASVARNTLTVVPAGKFEPDDKPDCKKRVGVPQLSVAVGVAYVTYTEQGLPTPDTATDPGQVITGGVLSVTVTEKERGIH